HVESAFAAAIERGRVKKIVRRGDFDRAEGTVFEADYSVGLAPTAAVEPLTATARISGDGLEIWAATQAPGFARAAAARAAGMSPGQVTLYPTLAGGGYGRRLENAAIEQAAILAGKTGRPVQLSWSRIEETLHDSFRPPARASMGARVGAGGSIAGWHARIAAPPTLAEVSARMRGHELDGARSEDAAVAGAEPPYAIANLVIEHLPVAIGVPTGIWRSAAHSYTAFFTECFIDELARQAKVEPLSFRMQMLGDNPRLARALTTAAQLGGWDGGAPGSAKGIAAHSAFGSHAALVVEVAVDKAQRPRVSRAVCAVDCGRIINPDIVKQQVEGAIIFGIAAATGNRISYRQGLPTAIGYKDLALPLLAESPEVIVELIPSDEDPGGVTELGVPPVAPAIANAWFALTGLRRRSLPLVDGGA
ncbi:MAG: molybdopterin cofactor-binding domain-containing protein, partial [Sphingomonadales bacterium]